MAEVRAVYDATPTPRTPADILPATEQERREAVAGPVTAHKWLVASVAEDAATVVGRVFDEAQRRDPEHQRSWVALVDGNNHHIHRIGAEARARQVSVSVVIDLIHVLEDLSAPRGALLYPPPSGEGLEDMSLGPMAYLDSKGNGQQHARKPAAEPRHTGRRVGGPARYGESWIA